MFELPLHSYVAAVIEPVCPPKTKPSVFVPTPPEIPVPVLKSVVSVQLAPSYFSVTAKYVEVDPPAASAEVLLVPIELAISLLAVFKLFTAVQFVPFQDSVNAENGGLKPP